MCSRNDNDATVYYLPGTTGCGPTFGGRPTMLWTSLPTIPHAATATAILVNDFVVGATITDGGLATRTRPP